MAGEDDPTPQFSGNYWSMPNGREYAVFVEAAALPGWVHSWDRGGLTSALLMAVLVRSRHKGPPRAAIVVSGRKSCIARSSLTSLWPTPWPRTSTTVSGGCATHQDWPR